MFQWLPRFRRTRRSVRVVQYYRPRLELLEDRRAPGDAVAGALLTNFMASSACFSPAAGFADTFADEEGSLSALTTAVGAGYTIQGMDQPNAALVPDVRSTPPPEGPQQKDQAPSTQESIALAKNKDQQGLDLLSEPAFDSLADANNLFTDLLTQHHPAVVGSFASPASLQGLSSGELAADGASAPSAAVQTSAFAQGGEAIAHADRAVVAAKQAADPSSDGLLAVARQRANTYGLSSSSPIPTDSAWRFTPSLREQGLNSSDRRATSYRSRPGNGFRQWLPHPSGHGHDPSSWHERRGNSLRGCLHG
jgi:hypothetical protein